MDYKNILQNKEYDFLRNHPNLGDNILLLGVSGSHAYGTNIESSDLDIRGIAINSAREILTGNDFEQVADTDTDTVIYSFNKFMRLLKKGNPNSLELLGLREEDYLVISRAGRLLMDKRGMFLSKRIFNPFWGYSQSCLEEVYRSVRKNSPNIARISKQMMHIIRLLSFGTDILKEGDIFTFREHDHDLLMAIRNGEYLKETGNGRVKIDESFAKLVSKYTDDLVEAKENTFLPDDVEHEEIEGFIQDVNLDIISDALIKKQRKLVLGQKFFIQ